MRASESVLVVALCSLCARIARVCSLCASVLEPCELSELLFVVAACAGFPALLMSICDVMTVLPYFHVILMLFSGPCDLAS